MFDTALGHGNIDDILDFNVADDAIGLDNAVFTALTMNAGVDLRGLYASEFRAGRGSMDSTDRIIYNSQTGALLYDSDGIGAAAAVQFASVKRGARHHRQRLLRDVGAGCGRPGIRRAGRVVCAGTAANSGMPSSLTHTRSSTL